MKVRRGENEVNDWLSFLVSCSLFPRFYSCCQPCKERRHRAPYKGLCNKCDFKASFSHFDPRLTESQSDVSLLRLGNFLMVLCTDVACCLDQWYPCPSAQTLATLMMEMPVLPQYVASHWSPETRKPLVSRKAQQYVSAR